MAVGEDAVAAGFALVPTSGEDGKVKYGAREINRTRDYVAQVKDLMPSDKAAFQAKGGITYGSADPSGGADGDIYFKVV